MLNIKNLLLVFTVFLLAITSISFAQQKGIEKYSQVRISVISDNDIQKINNAGLFFDGGIYKKGLYFETWLSESEIAMLKNSGVSYQILIDDWYSFYNNVHKNSGTAPHLSNSDVYTISHSIYGTMGGHLKWEEAIAKLDSMRLQYPTLISSKFSIGNSYENRPMWTIRVTKNPDAPTGRPEIWYNGVTHAREPMGMMNIFYYIYWLLENYNIDPLATYILNNREIYFTPFINPDGYYYNQTTNPGGGGMWRKNRTPQGTSTGVDLNRNFGTWNFWNSTNGGSSTSPSSDTYRGLYPFSEPETQNFKTFVNSRNFKTELDYHTYGNYLIKPWAWCDPTPTPDDAVFNEYGNDNNNILPFDFIIFGTPTHTVNYGVRGGDLDWLYSTDSTGHANHIFAMTPEIGTSSDYFWAPQSRIIPLSQMYMNLNIYTSLAAGQFASFKTATFNKIVYSAGESGNVKVIYRNKGRVDAQNIKIQITPVTNYITFPVQVYTKSSLSVFAFDSTTFNFNIASNCPNNTALTARLKIMQNDTVVLDNKLLNILVGAGNSVLIDSAENGTANWPTLTNWSIVTNKYLSPTHSFKGNCVASTTCQMVSSPLNVSSFPAVFLSFYQKYAFETDFDFGFVDISSNNGSSWQRIGRFTGIDSSAWKMQSFNITSFVSGSTNMLVRFRDSCDGGVNWDGWYIDNIRITGYNLAPTVIRSSGNNLMPDIYTLEQNYPNPFNPVTQINYSIAKEGLVKISIYDVLGREVKTLVNEVKTPGFYAVDFDGTNLSSGMYFYRMESGSFVDTKKMTLIK